MLKNLRILCRLIMIAAIPTFGALLLGAEDIHDFVQQRSQSARIVAHSEMGTRIGEAVHQLQKERGLSAGFVSSKGATFADKLPGQRQAADTAIADIARFVRADDELDAQDRARTAAWVASLGELASIRRDVDRFAAPGPELAKRYTMLIGKGLDAIDAGSAEGASGLILRETGALQAILRAKEAAGQERATASAGFSSGFTDEIHRKFISLLAVQDHAFKRFALQATREQVAALDAIEKDKAAEPLKAMREAAGAGSTTVDPNQWWQVTTARIDRLKQIQDEIAGVIGDEASYDYASASRGLWLHIVFVAILAIGGTAAVASITLSISRPLHRIKDTTDQMAQGDLSGEDRMPPPGRSELGQLAESVRAFRVQLATADEAKREQERLRKEQARLIVESVGSGLTALADGDLTHRIEHRLEGEFAVLREDYNRAVEALNELMGVVADCAREIGGGSTEIASASADLARRTEANAASVEQTSAALVQIDQRVRQSADSADETARRAHEATEAVGEGRGIAERTVAAMNGVSDRARDIDTVIEGLDKIAFQTRVLAMNAAVEAGRAGEAGRGFAVVADLVSALAMRAEEEAKTARERLVATQDEIGVAVEAVRKVDRALETIDGSVSNVHALLDRIAEDNKAQSITLGEVNEAVRTMDSSTQQNAAMVEQTSAAARTLSATVQTLVDRVGRFRTRRAAGVAPTVRALEAA